MKTLNFFSVSQMCASLDLESEPITIDLHDVHSLHLFALIYLFMLIRHYNSHGRRFRIIPPQSEEVRQYLAMQRLYRRLKFDINSIREEELNRIESTTSFNDIVDIEQGHGVAEIVSEKLMQMLTNNRLYLGLGRICEAVAEVVDNFDRHAEQRLAAMIVQYFPNERILSIAIGDCGVGIRGSLVRNPRHAYLETQPHHVAIAEAFKPLVSGRLEGGTGLYELKNFIADVSGYLYC